MRQPRDHEHFDRDTPPALCDCNGDDPFVRCASVVAANGHVLSCAGSANCLCTAVVAPRALVDSDRLRRLGTQREYPRGPPDDPQIPLLMTRSDGNGGSRGGALRSPNESSQLRRPQRPGSQRARSSPRPAATTRPRRPQRRRLRRHQTAPTTTGIRHPARSRFRWPHRLRPPLVRRAPVAAQARSIFRRS